MPVNVKRAVVGSKDGWKLREPRHLAIFFFSKLSVYFTVSFFNNDIYNNNYRYHRLVPELWHFKDMHIIRPVSSKMLCTRRELQLRVV